ncbi:unnamed protein product [Spirodela intermedia]|uniref:Uncharacterized protein n=1 Tax=Spirodela intermedia TaxID=51605 RepID=A0ABN7E9R6_SPIIN|nr:unnamed protein product [Spirodela intermedia]
MRSKGVGSGPASGLEAQSGSSREQGLERLAWIDRVTCAPIPFHVTGGQPAVGQGVVVHTRGLFVCNRLRKNRRAELCFRLIRVRQVLTSS